MTTHKASLFWGCKFIPFGSSAPCFESRDARICDSEVQLFGHDSRTIFRPAVPLAVDNVAVELSFLRVLKPGSAASRAGDSRHATFVAVFFSIAARGAANPLGNGPRNIAS